MQFYDDDEEDTNSTSPETSSTEKLVLAVTVRVFKGPLFCGSVSSASVGAPDQVVPFAAVCESEVLGAREAPEDAVDHLPVRLAGVVEELRAGLYDERDVGARGDGHIHVTANSFSVRHTPHARGFVGVLMDILTVVCCAGVLTNLASVRLKRLRMNSM